MRDLKLVPEDGSFGLALKGGDALGDSSLGTPVLVSLFSDVRANEDEVPPESMADLRGWWADALLALEGDTQGVGSKLWTLKREKEVPAVLLRAQHYAEGALQWLLDEGLVSELHVTATAPRPRTLSLSVTLTPLSAARQRVSEVWSCELGPDGLRFAGGLA